MSETDENLLIPAVAAAAANMTVASTEPLQHDTDINRTNYTKKSLANLKTANEASKSEFQQLNSQLLSYVDKARGLETENIRLSRDVNLLKAKNVTPTIDYDKEYGSELADVRSRLETECYKCIVHEVKIELNEDAKDEYIKRIRFFKNESDSNKQKIAQLHNVLANMDCERQFVVKNAMQTENEIANEQERHRRAEIDLDNLRRKLAEMRLENKKLEFEIQTLSDEKDFSQAVHEEELANLESFNKSVSSDVDLTTFYRNELLNAVKEIHNDFQRLKDQQLADMKQRKEAELDYHRDLVQKKTAAHQHEQANDSVDLTIDDLANELGKNKQELNELNSVYNQKLTKLKSIENDVRSMREQLLYVVERKDDDLRDLKKLNNVYLNEIDVWDNVARNTLMTEIQAFKSLLNFQQIIARPSITESNYLERSVEEVSKTSVHSEVNSIADDLKSMQELQEHHHKSENNSEIQISETETEAEIRPIAVTNLEPNPTSTSNLLISSVAMATGSEQDEAQKTASITMPQPDPNSSPASNLLTSSVALKSGSEQDEAQKTKSEPSSNQALNMPIISVAEKQSSDQDEKPKAAVTMPQFEQYSDKTSNLLISSVAIKQGSDQDEASNTTSITIPQSESSSNPALNLLVSSVAVKSGSGQDEEPKAAITMLQSEQSNLLISSVSNSVVSSEESMEKTKIIESLSEKPFSGVSESKINTGSVIISSVNKNESATKLPANLTTSGSLSKDFFEKRRPSTVIIADLDDEAKTKPTVKMEGKQSVIGSQIASDKESGSLRKMFDTFDKNRSGYIDRNELKNIFAILEINISSTNFEKFLQDIDADGNNQIDFEEFMKLMNPVLSEKQTRDELFKTFQYFDRDNSGYITVVELSTILQQFGSVYSDKQISEMIAQVDRDADGRLNFDEFYYLLTKKPSSEKSSPKPVKPKARKSISYVASYDASQAKSNRDREVLKRVFDKFDYDKSGFISPRELTNVFSALGLNNSEKACQDVFKQIDSNNSHDIDFEEFFRLVQPALAGHFTREQLSDAFRSFDKDKSGQISVRELSSILSALGQYYDDKQIARLIAKVDKNYDGQLSFEEFVALMTHVH